MVWQLRTPTIVMITNLVEAERQKCVRYWPKVDADDYGPFRVFLSGESVYGNYVIRTFHVNVRCCHGNGWGYHGDIKGACPS